MKEILNNNNEQASNKSPVKRGRSNALKLKRDECLADRYYYLGRFTDKRYNNIVAILTAEFFLSPETISNIIQSQSDYISNLKRNKPGIYYFQNKYPHYKWKLSR